MSAAGDPGPPPVRSTFPVEWAITTRWMDNDMFGHLNNAVYYSLFDTAINAWLAEVAGADPMGDAALPLVAESSCRYVTALAYPEPVVVGIAVDRLGRSSVTYRLGLYAASLPPDEPVAAVGHWVHVYVDRTTRRPVDIPAALRAAHASALVADPA